MQNFVVIDWEYFKLKQSKFSSNFEFDRNTVSGTSTWHVITCLQCYKDNVSWNTIVLLFTSSIITLRPRQNGHHFTDGILKWISFNENVRILIEILLKLEHMGRINNIPALIQIMAWCCPGNYPTLRCDIQGFRAMGLSVQYWPRWFQNFRRSDWLYHSEQMGPIWGSVPCQKKIFFVCEISCFWVK